MTVGVCRAELVLLSGSAVHENIDCCQSSGLWQQQRGFTMVL